MRDLNGFIAELRRRRVARALLGWGVAAFAVLQVVEPVQHGLALPDWTLRAVVWLLAAGFPVTATLAWIFDLGPGGITVTPDAAPGAAPATPTRGRLGLAGLVAGSALVGASLAGLALRAPPPPAAEPDGRTSVAVADFANATGDPELDGLSVLLGPALDQGGAFRMVSRSAMADALRQLGTSHPERIDEAAGRAASSRLGVGALLVGSVRALGGELVLELRALDPRREDYLFTLRERAGGKAALFDAVERLAGRAAERLRPARAKLGAVAGAETAPSASLAALRHYFDGQRAEDDYHYEAALAAYRQAMAADPAFVLARYRLWWIGSLAGVSKEEQQTALVELQRDQERLPRRERLLLEARAAAASGRFDEAEARYLAAAAAFPRDKEVLLVVGQYFLNQIRAGAAHPWLERALELDPTWTPALEALTGILWQQGTRAEALDVARRLVAALPPGPKASFWRLLEVAATGRRKEAVALAKDLLAADRTWVYLDGVNTALLLAEAFPELEALMREARARATSPMERQVAVWTLGTALAYQGRWREADALAEELGPAYRVQPWRRLWYVFHLEMRRGGSPACLAAGREFLRLDPRQTWMAWSMAYMGQAKEAAEIARGLAPERGLPLYQAVAEWRRGEAQGALRGLRSQLADPNLSWRHVATWFHALIAFDAESWAETVAAADEADWVYGAPWQAWGRPLVLLKKARAQERLGDRAGALVTVDRLLAWWPNPDPDAPFVAEARTLRAQWTEPHGAKPK